MPLPRVGGANPRALPLANAAPRLPPHRALAPGAAAAGAAASVAEEEEDNLGEEEPEPHHNVPEPQGPHGDQEEDNLRGGGEQEAAEEGTVTYCCLPGGCSHLRDVIYLADPGDAVKMVCNNESCSAGEWMHGDCFVEWERQVFNYLRTCGRARSWSDKQRLQNLWTKKGYDLAFKACNCNCAKGHLRKDLGYIPPPSSRSADVDKRQRKIRKAKIPQRRGSTGTTGLQAPGETVRAQLRIRTSSLCSTGSSPPSSEGMSPQTSAGAAAKLRSSGATGGKFDFFADPEQAAAGNIFWRRTDLSAFRHLPVLLQNPYQIKVEDEGPHGNDETRSFILTNLSLLKVTVVACVVCHVTLPVYDKYPLIDGTFFLSPHKYSVNSVLVQQAAAAASNDHHPRRLYLNAVCMQCLSGSTRELACLQCRSAWSGVTLIIGTMYAYDIFAAIPCCAWRLVCKSCCRQIVEPGAYQFFSQYSRLVTCPHCSSEDFHFVRPLQDIFRLLEISH